MKIWPALPLLLTACAGPPPKSPKPTITVATTPVESPLVYVVETDRSAEVLMVTATVPPGLSDAFGTDEDSARYVEAVTINGEKAAFRSGVVTDARCRAQGCSLGFRYRLADAARAMREPDYALEARGAFVAAPSTFLLRPLEEHPGRFRLVVRGTPFVASLAPVAPGDPAAGYEGELHDLAATGYVGLGDLTIQTLAVGGSEIAVAMDRGVHVERQATIVAWVRSQTEAVARFYGGFPVRRAAIFIDSVRGRDVVFGKTLGHGAASIVVMVGQTTKAETLQRDWVLSHELVHLALPALPTEQRWFEEGVATYIEPAVRAEAGLSTAEKAWEGLSHGMGYGLPRAGDRGLDHTDTWGRRYWGGALFCLEADRALRQATGNQKGFRDALRIIRETAGGIDREGDLGPLLAAADTKLGVHVLKPLYDRWAHEPVMVDLDRTWADLGVVKATDGVTLDAAAPQKSFRQAIVHAEHESPSARGDGKEPRMEKTSSGLQFEDTVVGTGASPTRGQTCKMHYTGWLWVNEAKGAKFDSSLDRGSPFSFKIGVGQVIAGWDEGVSTMKVGGKRSLLIPAELGYGSRGAGGVIPPNATLLFEVELLGIQ